MASPAAGSLNNYLIIAVGKPVQYNLTVTNNGNGTVTKDPDQGTFNAGTLVTLTANPSAGYQFTGWSGSASGTGNPLTVTMDGTKTISANFSAIQYGLSVSTNGNGSVLKSPDQVNYNAGSTVILTATPASGQQFTGWSGSVTGATNPLTVTMDATKTITANFSAVDIEYNLTIKTNGDGSVSKNPDASSYQSGSTVTLTANPGAGQEFTGWSGDGSGSTNPLTVSMDGDKVVTATFSAIEYNLSINTNGNGRVSKDPDQLTYESGAAVNLTATPDDGYRFTGWSGDGEGTDNPLPVIMDKNNTITATFELNQEGRPGKMVSDRIERKPGLYSIEKSHQAPRLYVYPNPVSGGILKVIIFDLLKRQNISIVVSDIFGKIYKTLKEVTDENGTLNKRINLDKFFSKDIYFLKITSSSFNKVIKIVVD